MVEFEKCERPSNYLTNFILFHVVQDKDFVLLNDKTTFDTGADMYAVMNAM